MTDALELFCHMSENQRSLDTGSPLLLARIQHVGGEPAVPGEIVSASYTVWRLDDRDAAVRTAVPGHEDVAVPVAECLLPEPVIDENWTHDAKGYNFRHIPRSTNPSASPEESTPLFPVPGRNYLVEYRLIAEDPAAPDILLRYRIHVV